jgi:hypothetical protein
MKISWAVLSGLVDKSMLTAETDATGGPRDHMLESLRLYGRARLAEEDRLDLAGATNDVPRTCAPPRTQSSATWWVACRPDYVEKGRQALYNDSSAEEFPRYVVYCNPRPAAGGRIRQCTGDCRALRPDPAHLHPLHRGPHCPSCPAGSHDQRGRHRDSGQQGFTSRR